jgi:SAM-dependent methyltransferase
MPAAALIRRTRFAFLLAAFSAALAAPAFAQAQKEASTYEPSSGQPGKDVVWVPTPQVVVDKMLDMAKLGSRDFVMDLGSGDGRTVITAAKRGARALGVEYNPDMVELPKRNAEKEGVSGKAAFIKADLFETDFSRASVITMFLLPEINLKLRPKLLALKPGTRIASNTFTMGDWEADESVTLTAEAGCNTYWCTALLWIVPARVAGTHTLPQGELTLKQQYQMLSGTLRTEGKTFVLEGKVRGEEISFTAGGRTYRGRMNGKTLELR